MRPSIIQFVIEDLFRVQFSNMSLNNLRDSILEAYDSLASSNASASLNVSEESNVIDCTIREKYSTIINDIIDQCSKVYKIESQTDDELIKYWYYLMNRVVLVSNLNKEINDLSTECKSKINNSTWQRLKSIKMYLLSKNN